MDYDSLFEKIKTDKDFVIAEHRKMWNAIADYSEKYGRCLNKYEYLAFYWKDYLVECLLMDAFFVHTAYIIEATKACVSVVCCDGIISQVLIF